MKSGRPAYLANEELDVKSDKAQGLPHGATIAVGALFFLALSVHYHKVKEDTSSCRRHSSKAIGPCASATARRSRRARARCRFKVEYCGICGTDLHLFHGAMAHRLTLPHVMGHEMSGTIAAIGPRRDRAGRWAIASPCVRSTRAALVPPARRATATSATT